MPSEAAFRSYIQAFNRHDRAAYTAHYAPEIVLTNGAGTRLEGRAQIADFYDALKDKVRRQIEIVGVVSGENALAAALRSEFEVLADGTEWSGQMLARGDRVRIESMALYEFSGDLFRSITATTLRREIIRGEGA